jgi:hypothetical protein
MSLFHAKIEPFCALTIDLGPQYVERVFDSILTRQGDNDLFRMKSEDRFAGYLEYLNRQVRQSNRHKYCFIQFYCAYFSQQLAIKSGKNGNERQHLWEKALFYYQVYLELADHSTESKYYAHWQSGLLQDALQYPWSQAEISLLKAASIDPLRGEALKKLVLHYCQESAWKIAYGCSTLAIQKFFDKNPVGKRRWFVDFEAYNWSLLYTHFTICYKLGLLQEAEQVYRQMHGYIFQHPDELTDADIHQIQSLHRLFHPAKSKMHTAP